MHDCKYIILLLTPIVKKLCFFPSSRKKPSDTHHLARLIFSSSSQKKNFPLLTSPAILHKCNHTTFLLQIIHQSINFIHVVYSKPQALNN